MADERTSAANPPTDCIVESPMRRATSIAS